MMWVPEVRTESAAAVWAKFASTSTAIETLVRSLRSLLGRMLTTGRPCRSIETSPVSKRQRVRPVATLASHMPVVWYNAKLRFGV